MYSILNKKYYYSSLLAMLYDTVNHPQDSATLFEELLMKCIWKIVKDFERWDDGICYDLVLAQVHRFLEVIKFIIF